ncbi:MAG: hypothetical protein QNJ90_08855 [Planctomycetota bacterium]|nr:hypothetical protein [Planctomycetota bacterium]
MLEDRVFSQAESCQISDKFTAVQLLGGNDLDEEGKAFMARYGVQGFPTLLAMTPDGAVVGRQFERTLEGIIAAMEQAVTTNEEFKKTEAELGEKKDDESIRKLSGLYKERAQLDEARKGYEALTKKDPQVADQEALLQVLSAQGDNDARKALLKVLVDTRGDHEKHIRWRMDHAMADLPTQVTSREEWLDVLGKRKAALEGLLPKVEKEADQAEVRGMLAQILSNTGDREGAQAHWDWILEKAPKSGAAAAALWMKGQNLIRQGQFEGDPAKVEEAKTIWQQLADDHPDTMFGKRAGQLMPQLDGLIQMLEAKKAAAEEAARKKAEEKKEGDEEKPEEKKDDSVPATPIR